MEKSISFVSEVEVADFEVEDMFDIDSDVRVVHIVVVQANKPARVQTFKKAKFCQDDGSMSTFEIFHEV